MELRDWNVIIQDIILNYDKDFTFHDFRIVSGPTHTNLLFDVVIPIKYKKSPKVVKDFIIPSKENIFKSPDRYTDLFILSIKFEKLILVLNKLSPILAIAFVTREIIAIICSQIQREEFIKAIKIIALKINCFGESTLE